MVAWESTGVDGEHVRKLVRTCLGRFDTMQLDDLTRFVGMDNELVDRELSKLMAEGEVEVLKPIGGDNSKSIQIRGEAYYRLIRASDRDFLWEHELHEEQHNSWQIDLAKVWMKASGGFAEADGFVDVGIAPGLSLS